MAGVKSPFGSKVTLTDDTAERLAPYGYEVEKKTSAKSSSKSDK